MKRILICGIIFFGITTAAYCGVKNRIELADGSVITAEIISFNNGVYSLNAGNLGMIQVDASKIKKIEAPIQNYTPAVNIPGSINVDSIQSGIAQAKEKISSNPETMKMVTDLMTVPEFQAMLNDPEIANAARSGDIKTLMSNERFMSMVNHPRIKAIQNKIDGGN